jgi:hypothetical protein
MPDVKNFDYFSHDPVRKNVWQPRMWKLSGTLFAPFATAMGKLFEGTDGTADLNNGGPRLVRVVRLKEVEDVLQIFSGRNRPADFHQD